MTASNRGENGITGSHHCSRENIHKPTKEFGVIKLQGSNIFLGIWWSVFGVFSYLDVYWTAVVCQA